MCARCPKFGHATLSISNWFPQFECSLQRTQRNILFILMLFSSIFQKNNRIQFMSSIGCCILFLKTFLIKLILVILSTPLNWLSAPPNWLSTPRNWLSTPPNRLSTPLNWLSTPLNWLSATLRINQSCLFNPKSIRGPQKNKHYRRTIYYLVFGLLFC